MLSAHVCFDCLLSYPAVCAVQPSVRGSAVCRQKGVRVHGEFSLELNMLQNMFCLLQSRELYRKTVEKFNYLM